MADPLATLARADTTSSLPRLGGMARPDGIVIASDRFWAYARVDGTVREGQMPRTPSSLGRLPLVRGLARLAASVTPLFRGSGVARPAERLALALALVVPFGFVLLPERVAFFAGIALTGALLVWLFRGRTRALHGAEHRAIAAVEERRLVATWRDVARPTRFARRCGTNFAALVLPVAAIADAAWPMSATAVLTPVVVALLSLALSMEIWRAVQGSEKLAARLLLLPGFGLQRLTTSEPTPAETRVALAATASVLRRELAPD
ncbi:MAG: DUF1385 domain-containing protein [Thermoleophilia bacterium]|nr:DUF1385 domain-containing protein [Thermoleophilia bacterium]